MSIPQDRTATPITDRETSDGWSGDAAAVSPGIPARFERHLWQILRWIALHEKGDLTATAAINEIWYECKSALYAVER